MTWSFSVLVIFSKANVHTFMFTTFVEACWSFRKFDFWKSIWHSFSPPLPRDLESWWLFSSRKSVKVFIFEGMLAICFHQISCVNCVVYYRAWLVDLITGSWHLVYQICCFCPCHHPQDSCPKIIFFNQIKATRNSCLDANWEHHHQFAVELEELGRLTAPLRSQCIKLSGLVFCSWNSCILDCLLRCWACAGLLLL